MIDRNYSILEKMVYSFLLIAFPLNFFYALFYVLGYFPQIPLFGFTTFIHLGSICILLSLTYYYKKLLNVKYVYILIFLLIQMFVYTVVGYFFSDYAFDGEVLAQSILITYYLFIYSCFGFSIFYFNLIKSKALGWMLFFFLTSVVFLYFKNGTFSFYFHLMNPNAVTINYQEVSSIFLFVWLFYYAGEENLFKRSISILVAAIILTASGARSEFFGFLLSFAYLLLLTNVRLNINKIKNIVLILFFLSILIYLFQGFLLTAFEESRQFTVTNLDEDGSWQQREYFFKRNLENIINHPILGNYASHFELSRGSYIHNILSSWQQYGLIGFILYFLLIIIPFVVLSIHSVVRNDRIVNSLLFLATYSLILCFVTKSVYWHYLGLSVGGFAYYCFYFKKGLIKKGIIL